MKRVEKSPARWILNIVLAGLTITTIIGIAVPQAMADGDYVGVKKCKVCHMNEFNAWQKTKMSQAFELLKPGTDAEGKKNLKYDPDKDYTNDNSCLECHTTGYGKGGFQSIGATPDLAGVTCEACHGPGGKFVKAELMSLSNKEFKLAELQAAGLNLPKDASTCTTSCHNDRSPAFVAKGSTFDFEQRNKQGVHEHFPLKYQH